MNKKKEIVVEVFKWLLEFWIFKLSIALLTCVLIGCFISGPVVLSCKLIFMCFNADAPLDFFCSSFCSSLMLDSDFELLAVNYLRVGLLESPFLIVICALRKAEEIKTIEYYENNDERD